jgi:predicted DNA-binding protein (MmcQ/YjbR family)
MGAEMDVEPIFTRAGFEAFVLGLRGTTLVRQWGDSSVAKIGGKIFALVNSDPGEIWLKVSDMAFDMLPELPGVRPAPYLARASWVAIGPGSALTGSEVEAYVVEAHRLVASRLTRKLRAELALDAIIAAAPHRP